MKNKTCYYNHQLFTITSSIILIENDSGGRIDHAHHYNNPYRALDETLVLEEALLSVLSVIDQSETLIIVTSDHSHVLTIGGVANPRGNPILGKFIVYN